MVGRFCRVLLLRARWAGRLWALIRHMDVALFGKCSVSGHADFILFAKFPWVPSVKQGFCGPRVSRVKLIEEAETSRVEIVEAKAPQFGTFS